MFGNPNLDVGAAVWDPSLWVGNGPPFLLGACQGNSSQHRSLIASGDPVWDSPRGGGGLRQIWGSPTRRPAPGLQKPTS